MNEKGSRRIFPTCIVPLTFYLMTAMAISFEVLPTDAFAIFGTLPQGDTLWISLSMGCGFLVLGAVLHLLLYRWNPERFDTRAFRSAAIGMAILMAALIALSLGLSRGTGLPPEVLKSRFDSVMDWIAWIALGLIVLIVAGIAIFIAGAFLLLRFHTANRMARKLAAGDFAGAIKIGESRPPSARDFTTNVNLVAAYTAARQFDQAGELLASMESIEGVPKYYTAETLRKTLDDLKAMIDRETSAQTPGEVPDGGSASQ